MITTVTGKNQVTIPTEIARALDIQPRTRLDWEIGEDGTLIGQPLARRGQLAREAAGMRRQWLPEGADPVGDLIRERAGEDKDEGSFNSVSDSISISASGVFSFKILT